jgi:5'-nucleotidase
MNRKEFLHYSIKAAAAIALTPNLLCEAAVAEQASKQLSILHTNDVHSRLDPFPMDGGKYQGLGGIRARANLLQQIRQEPKANILLLDSGDMFQGTPYFNLYKGEAEILAMNKLGYDCGTLGNHDFDAGLDNLLIQLNKANFPIVACNYDFSNTILEDKIAPYTIVKKGGVKIGIIGVGIALQGLVPENLYGATVYKNPVPLVNTYARKLKHSKGCDLVVCLSHLGYAYDGNKLSDKTLAAETTDVDIILGGHTHTFLDEPTKVKNKNGQDVFINQVGFAGIKLGRLDFDFFQKKNSENKLSATSGIIVE